jgi:hypothetical protein
MRSLVLLFASILAFTFAAACGGQTSGAGHSGDGGTGSSGSSGSSGGGSSGGSSSGAGDDVDAFPGDDSTSCPESPPTPQTSCFADGADCSYGSAEGCGESCVCQDGVWSCAEPPCSEEACPPAPPQSETACQGAGSACLYPINGACENEECDCEPSGSWYCYPNDCIGDGGESSDGGGPFDAGPCPGAQPPASAGCPDQGLVCTYFDPCETNCLCATSGWVCAAEPGCAQADF